MTDSQTTEKCWKKKTQFKVLMDSHSAFVPPDIQPSRVDITARVDGVYHRTSGLRAELNHWQAKAARRYLLSEIESARRTDPCWHVSSRPCQLYLIVPIATCRTITPTIPGACSL